MSETTDKPRIRPTPGPWTKRGMYSVYNYAGTQVAVGDCGDTVELIADAGNTFHATGLLPSELADAAKRGTWKANPEYTWAEWSSELSMECEKLAAERDTFRHELERVRDLVGEVDVALIDEVLKGVDAE